MINVSSARSRRRNYQPTCVWPSRPVRRVAVLTAGPATADLVAALSSMVGPEHIVRRVERHPTGAPATDGDWSSVLDELDPWWEWADVVITDPCDASIAECVEHGYVPAVAMTRSASSPFDAHQAMRVVQPWSSAGLALQLSMDNPTVGVLDAAAGLQARPARTAPGLMWLGA